MDMKDEREKEGGTRERASRRGVARWKKKEKGEPYWLLDLHPLNLEPWGSIIGVLLFYFFLT